jgi:hypothetical protein
VAATWQSSKDGVLLQYLVGEDKVRETLDENLLGLWSEPVMTTLTSVAPLLGGITEE